MSKNFKIVGEDISDGYHTFDELYEHRIHLFIALAFSRGHSAYYKLPEPGFDGWFVMYLELPHGQISYHLPSRFLPVVARFAKLDPEHKWDGHSSNDVLKRLMDSTGMGI